MSTVPPSNSLAYVGIKESNPPELHFRNRAPTVDDARPYDRGDLWIDTVAQEAYILIVRVGAVATWVGCAGTGAAETLTGDSGGAVSPDIAENINVLGGVGISTVGTPGTNTITVNATGTGMAWTEVVGVAAPMVVNTGYVANNAGLVTLTLPATAAFGSVINVVGKGAGLFTIAQNALQTVHYGNQDSTPGVGGSIAATHRYDTIEIVCTTVDLNFTVIASTGNFIVT